MLDSIIISISVTADFGGKKMRRLLIVFLPILLLVVAYVYLYRKDESAKSNEKIVVYTYSSFASSWGAGPEIKKLFKEKTGHDAEFIDVGEAGIILQRVLLEKNNTIADVILGLDQFQIELPEIQNLFSDAPRFNINVDQFAPSENIQTSKLLAYNWAPMTFIYRQSDKDRLPKNLEDLLSQDVKGKLVLLDPRTSSPGYIFFEWVVWKLGIEGSKKFFKQLKPKIYTVTPSWSAGYGLFKKKQSQYIFSYLTSPVYHWKEEGNVDYQPVYLEEELPYHIEYVGILKSSSRQKIAEEFVEFLLDPEAQKIIMNKNYMLPIAAGVSKNSDFSKLKNIKLFKSENRLSREEVLNVWKSIPW